MFLSDYKRAVFLTRASILSGVRTPSSFGSQTGAQPPTAMEGCHQAAQGKCKAPALPPGSDTAPARKLGRT